MSISVLCFHAYVPSKGAWFDFSHIKCVPLNKLITVYLNRVSTYKENVCSLAFSKPHTGTVKNIHFKVGIYIYIAFYLCLYLWAYHDSSSSEFIVINRQVVTLMQGTSEIPSDMWMA